MAVSDEFIKAVRENNILRIRIMLKDSLLVDKTFSLFSELLLYAEARGVSVWENYDEPLEKEAPPWTLDTMNYELTALVNDFTKEHVLYVKQIIKELFKSELQSKNIERYQTQSNAGQNRPLQPGSSMSNAGQNNKNAAYYRIIRDKASQINTIVENSRKKGKWYRSDIESIEKYAKELENACEKIRGGW